MDLEPAQDITILPTKPKTGVHGTGHYDSPETLGRCAEA